MKRLLLVCTMLMVVAAATASAQELPLCFKWVSFCDGVGVNNKGIGGAYWYKWDCENNSPMDASKHGSYTSNCETDGSRVLRHMADNDFGDYYFIVDMPYDGTLDMHMGTYPNGSCWIPALQYDLQMGACTGIKGQSRSTVQ